MADWHACVNGRAEGPFSAEELRGLLAEGLRPPTTTVWKAGMTDWAPADTIAELAMQQPPSGPTDKRILPAFLLAYFLGVFGAHRFYAGRTGSALAMLLISLTGIGLLVTLIWALVDWIVIAFGGFRDERGVKITEWT